MDTDDVEYKKSVRNMSVVLAAIAITIFAAIFIPPYVFPTHNVFLPSVSEESPYGFTLHLTVNSTSITSAGSVLLTGWINSSSATIQDINASDSWAIPQTQVRVCPGWPIGVGVMVGHYTNTNFSLGTVVPVTLVCPVQTYTPHDFILKPHSSKALVTIGGSTQIWVLQTSLSFRGYPGLTELRPGIYTAVLADEWGDVLTTNFQVK